MAAPYWGQLPPPKVVRGNSVRRYSGQGQDQMENNQLSIDTGAGDRRSNQSQPARQNRSSVQTEAPTISTQSPFASPVASEFRGDGLAPRPPSFPSRTSEAAYNRDYQEKRRRRESRDREQNYEDPSLIPPPAAPDAPRPPPPISYKQPYSNGPSSSNYQPVGRSNSRRRSEGPVSPSKARPEDYYRSQQRADRVDEDLVPSRNGGSIKGKEVVRSRNRPERTETSDSYQRKGSTASETEAHRRREWAPDRSPLQRLELTLDSITKEEKRARVEEAELLAREAKAGRGGERATQNSVRFRNRPVAKAPESGTQPKPEPQSLPEAGLVRNLSTKQKESLQRSGTVEKTKPIPQDISPTNRGRGFDYQSKQENPEPSPKIDKTSTPQRGPSFRDRDRSYIPVAVGAAGAAAAAGLSRSGSNKLKKDPPGDPWFNRRAEAEKQFTDIVAPKRGSISDRQATVSSAGPSRDTAFRSHPQVVKDKELPVLPKEAQQTSGPSTSRDHPEPLDEMDHDVPVRGGKLSKLERLTGEKAPQQTPRSQGGNDIRTERVTVNGVQYAVPPTAPGKSTAQNPPSLEPAGHHRISNILHPNQGTAAGPGVYVPSRRLDDWKKGSVALLSGGLLDLEVVEPTEAEKDKAWWEAGHTGKRRRSSTKPRKAEAYDGEYDDSNGMISHNSHADQCEACLSKKTVNKKPKPAANVQKGIEELTYYLIQHITFESTILKPHSLTCPMRPVRIRPDIAPTRFKPPLFLKSGPLLRYCGLRREPRTRSARNTATPDREIWRGSIMIVTQDSDSSYELAPTLRLFLQPTELLPPPPPQVDGEGLAPEYIDPIAGLPKIGRDGRTLYIRPVEHLEEAKDLSREESDEGLYEMKRSPLDGAGDEKAACRKPHYDGEKAGKYKEVRAIRLHAEQGVTFWRFNIEIELRDKQQRIAYRINRGPATGFWVPARDQAMNIMFHSCNGFSHNVDPNQFCGPDPLWRDVLNTHQTQPFHVMIGGGDQIYNDAVMYETTLYKEWSMIKDPHHKESCPFTPELQDELEAFYLNRYCMWFSQGLFGLAASQIPMINIYDDHDIIDGFGSYPDDYMRCAVCTGLGAVAFKYYMLFQHQTSIDEGEEHEPSWVLGTQPGPYIQELSRSIFTNLGRSIAFLGLDCRTERMNDEIVSAETYHKVFDRLAEGIVKGETKHLIVLVGIPVAYPRMVWLENILTSKAMEPIKALGRVGLLGKNLLNHMDGGVEILDDLDDHWTARHHKDERNWFIQELQDLAAEKSVRVTILGGDVHLGAIGQFYSNPRLGIPKDRDFRYMPNVISSAITNAPPADAMADILNRRNKVHHLDADTDEDMIPLFTHDVNGKPRNNKRLLNRRNWCSIRLYDPQLTPPTTPQTDGSPSPPPKRGLLRRLSKTRGPSYRAEAVGAAPPLSSAGFFGRRGSTSRRGSVDSERPSILTRTLSLSRKDFMPGTLFRRNSKKRPDDGGINGYGADSENDVAHYENGRFGIRGGSGGHDEDDGYFPAMAPIQGRQTEHPIELASTSVAGTAPQKGQFKRTPTGLSQKQLRKGGNFEINLEGGLDICLNMEVSPKDPSGITMPYRLLVPALWYEESKNEEPVKRAGGIRRWASIAKGKRKEKVNVAGA